MQKSDWLEMRKDKIGASDAPVIMHRSPWTTPYQLWEEKVGLRSPKTQTASMKRGLALENEALHSFEKMTGLVMFPQMVKIHPKNSWMMATLDGLTIDSKEILEIKCPGREDHDLAKKGTIPDKYIPQLQHQIEVCGVDSAYYFSYLNGEGVIVEVVRNQEFIEEMLAREQEFYQCMTTFTPPAKTARDKEYHKMDDDMWRTLAGQWLEVQQEIRLLTSREEELRATLIGMCPDKKPSSGFGISVNRVVKPGNIDYKSIPELQGVDLNAYRKQPSEYWTITKTKEG